MPSTDSPAKNKELSNANENINHFTTQDDDPFLINVHDASAYSEKPNEVVQTTIIESKAVLDTEMREEIEEEKHSKMEGITEEEK